MENIAPILLFVYNRLNHTKKTVESLLKNKLAEGSEFFIYSDGSKNNKDEEKVRSVRRFIKGISGFSKIEIIEKEKNFGLAGSVIDGVSQVLNLYDKVIVLEDDIVTSNNFLLFMNKALNFYQKDKNIFSVSGYTYPIGISNSYPYDVFISYRSSSWGWATWKDRWEKVDWRVKDYVSFKQDKNKQIQFNRAGNDFSAMLSSQMRGKIDSWAIRWAYAHFKNNAYCLFPTKPLCKNIGNDSSGTHSSTSKKYDVELNDEGEQIRFTDELELNQEITQNIKKFFRPYLFRRIVNSLKGL